MSKTHFIFSLLLILPFTVGTAQSFQEVIESNDKALLTTFLASHDIDECFGSHTLLTASAKHGSINILKALLKEGAAIDKICHRKKTALMIAAEHQQVQAGRILLRAGADASQKDDMGNSSFDLSLKYENFDLFNHLIRIKGESLAKPDGPFLFRQEGNMLAHLQIIKNKKDKIKTLATAIEGPFFYNRTWSCFGPQGKELFTFRLREHHKPSPAIYPSPEKLLAISDIEGNFEAFANLLQGNEVVNEKFEWTYGKGHLVLVGDFFDRGPQVTETLWLVYKLEAEAEKAGGKVHFVLGNHETMNLMGDFRYVAPKYFVHASLFDLPYASLYAPNSILGEWLRTKNTMVKIGETLFCHGGISQDFADRQLSIQRVNEITRQFLNAPQKQVKHDDSAKAIFHPSKGILWYRGYVQRKANSEKISGILDFYEAKAIVIGHTPVNEICQLYNGQVVAIDVPHTMGEEHQQALLIELNQMYAVGMHGKKRLLAVSTGKATP